MASKQKDKLQNQQQRIYTAVEWLLSEYDWVSKEQTKKQFIEKLKHMMQSR